MKASNTFSQLIFAPGLPPSNAKAVAPTKIWLENIQGDILFGLPKRYESFLFFTIKDPKAFQVLLKTKIAGIIASSIDVQAIGLKIQQAKSNGQHETVPVDLVNISFSASGLKALGVDISELGDKEFAKGQLKNAKDLGDAGRLDKEHGFIPDWESTYLKPIHGVFIVAAEVEATAHERVAWIIRECGSSIEEIGIQSGQTRPGELRHFEFFGFKDGISQPVVKGVVKETLDAIPIEQDKSAIMPGIILLGTDGDPVPKRPKWATDGSFMVFRKLAQLVPEFDKFLADNAEKVISGPGPLEAKIERLGARLMGRWKSGVPVALSPDHDDPKMPTEKWNEFDYKDDPSEIRCPFAAHTNPRLGGPKPQNPQGEASHRIMRTGITYGEELTASERDSQKTEKDRGLLFVCYQSSLSKGFQFIQQRWSNSVTFPPPGVPPPGSVLPGFDPIVGQTTDDNGVLVQRKMTGADPTARTKALDLTDHWVIPKGGEYFFSPSITAIKTGFERGRDV